MSLLPEVRARYPWLDLVIAPYRGRYPGDPSDLYSAALAGVARGERTYNPTGGTARATWLRLTVHSALRDTVRTQARFVRDQAAASRLPRQTPALPVQTDPWLRRRFERYLARTPAQGRRIRTLLAWTLDGYTAAELAAARGISTGGMDAYIHLARATLKPQYQALYDEWRGEGDACPTRSAE